MQLEKLQEVDIRKIWKHEQYDFSKWLSSPENIQELSDTLCNDLQQGFLQRLKQDRSNMNITEINY
ncbi:MAG: hypothetical protein IJ361_04260 [Spirochaetaceae bacterium]|nr:hypothetical protein [Spirochaetaceae bacterium]